MEGKYLFLRRVADAPGGLPKCEMSTVERGYYRILSADRLVASDFERVYIRPAGLAALAAEEYRLEQQRRQESQDEARRLEERAYLHQQAQKQFRHDWRVSLFEVLAGFVLGLIAQHFLDII